MLNTTEHTQLKDRLLTIKQAQEYMKCSHVFIWNIRKKGFIQTIHAGKKVLLPKSSLDNYLQLNKEVTNG